MAVKYGLPAVISVISAWSEDREITADDFRELEKKMKKPQDYFTE